MSSTSGSSPAQQPPATPAGGSEPTVEEAHRALTGWLSEDEAIAALLGRNPIPTDDLAPLRQTAAGRRQEVAGREPYEPTDPLVGYESRAGLDAVAARPEIEAAFAGMEWRTEMVDLEAVLSLQKSIRLTGLDARMLQVLENPANLFDFCLPTHQPTLPERVFTDLDGKGMTVSSLNPNLRVAGTQPIQIQAQSAVDAPPVPMQGLVVLVHLGASYLQVARYGGRCFLRDGYHRAAGLVRAGIIAVPCIFIEAHSFEEVAPSPGLFSYETMFGARPPRLADFWDPGVSDEALRPAVRKVIRVRGDEFVVQV